MNKKENDVKVTDAQISAVVSNKCIAVASLLSYTFKAPEILVLIV